MTPAEEFRLGFLLRCAQEGCTMAEVQSRVKLAADRLGQVKQANGALNALPVVGSTVRDIAGLGALWLKTPLVAGGLSVAGSGLAGLGVGYGIGKMQDTNADPEAAKDQELITAYLLNAERARRRAQQRSYRPQTPSVPRLS